MDGMTRTHTWANVVSHIITSARCEREKVTCEVYCLHLPSVAADCHQLYKKLQNFKVKYELQFFTEFHHEELEEDGCHLWYCWNEIGSARSSPDSRWRRCINVTAVRKSDRSLVGAFLHDLFCEINPFFKKKLSLLRGWAVRVVYLCHFIHCDALLLGPANLELRITV